MGLKKCPRCELNYIRDDEKLCNVCRRSAKLSDESEEEIMCIECGEHPANRGKDLCPECYRESLRLQKQHAPKASGMDYGDVDDVTDVTLPDEEIPMGTIPDEFGGEFDEERTPAPVEEGEIEFTKGASLEQMVEDEEAAFAYEEEDIDEGVTPARKTLKG